MANTLNLGTDGNWGVKKDSLLAYNSENGNFKPLAFNFTRASSATVVNKAGLIETVGSGEPRIDFKDDAKGALLLEPTRSNLVTYSEDFSNVQWNKESGVVVTDNYGISPDGTQNSTRLQLNALNKSIYYGITVGSASIFSIYIKGIQGEIVRVSNTGGTLHTFTGGWDRVECYDSVGNATNVSINSYGGSTTALDMEIYGAQLEQGSYATSYIPTSGSAVTRVQDVCNNGGNEQVINSTEGVLYAEVSTFVLQPVDVSISMSDGTFNNMVRFEYYPTIPNQIRAVISVGGANVIMTGLVTNSLILNKIALKWAANDYSLWANGVELDTDVTQGTFSANILTSLSLNRLGANGWYGNTKDVRVYNTALTDAELQALTK